LTAIWTYFTLISVICIWVNPRAAHNVPNAASAIKL